MLRDTREANGPSFSGTSARKQPRLVWGAAPWLPFNKRPSACVDATTSPMKRAADESAAPPTPPLERTPTLLDEVRARQHRPSRPLQANILSLLRGDSRGTPRRLNGRRSVAEEEEMEEEEAPLFVSSHALFATKQSGGTSRHGGGQRGDGPGSPGRREWWRLW